MLTGVIEHMIEHVFALSNVLHVASVSFFSCLLRRLGHVGKVCGAGVSLVFTIRPSDVPSDEAF